MQFSRLTWYQVLFYLWQIRPILKHCKVAKYYNQDFRLRPGLSHIREKDYKNCGKDYENSIHILHILVHCPNYLNEKSTFLNSTRNIDRKILRKSNMEVIETFLYDDNFSNNISNNVISNVTIDLLIANKRLDGSLFLLNMAFWIVNF